MIDDPKGELEVIVTYMGKALTKQRVEDVKNAEMLMALRDIFVNIMETLLEVTKGNLPKNVFPVYSEEQLRRI